ncbi:MAG: hypothetical protein ACOYYS_12600 [Chloroflexota bacterium]
MNDVLYVAENHTSVWSLTSGTAMVVTGHMAIRNRYQVVSGRQLRFASGRRAASPGERQYLLFDAGRPIESVEALSKGLRPISE